MNKERKKELIKEHHASSLEGLDFCLHGVRLYKCCIPCGREINEFI